MSRVRGVRRFRKPKIYEEYDYDEYERAAPRSMPRRWVVSPEWERAIEISIDEEWGDEEELEELEETPRRRRIAVWEGDEWGEDYDEEEDEDYEEDEWDEEDEDYEDEEYDEYEDEEYDEFEDDIDY